MTGFFSLEQRDGRWWFTTPTGERFWSIGMNHIDSAALRFPESGDTWQREFGNSQQRWLAAADPYWQVMDGIQRRITP
jgi:hypothetical protein